MTLQLLHGDCLELMKTLPDKSIDLFVCDLPYGCLGSKDMQFDRTGEWSKFPSKKSVKGCAWDIKINLTEFWVQVERLMKDEHTPIIHFCITKFGYELIQSKEDWFRYDLVWSKDNGTGFLMANKMPMRSHENIYVFAKKGATYYRKDIVGEFIQSHSRGKATQGNTNTFNGGNPLPLVEQKDNTHTRCVLSVIDMKRNGRTKGRHPTQKPAELYQWLIERYSKEGDTILDPTAGSFTSVFTAHKLKRNAIGIEKDDGFYQKALTNECVTTSQTSVHSSSGECSANDRQQSDIVHSD